MKYSYGKLAEEMVSLKRGVLHEVTGRGRPPAEQGATCAEIVSAVRCEQRVPLYVYGGGSSANKGFLPEKGGVTLVLTRT